MNIKEAAIFWGISESWACRLCATGRVPSAKKIKGRWIMHPLAAKPIDKRFKKPTITIAKTIWVKGKEINNKRCLFDCPAFTVVNGLVVIINKNERLTYMYKWGMYPYNKELSFVA